MSGQCTPLFTKRALLSLAGACLVLFNVAKSVSLVFSMTDPTEFHLLPPREETRALSNDAAAPSNDGQQCNYPEDGAARGIFSDKPTEFFRTLQSEIDKDDNEQRCQRYGFTYNRRQPQNRRLFLGTLITDEPWELLEILAAEAYRLYSGMVLVEGNRTQNFTPRRFQRLNHTSIIRQLFQAEQVQIRPFVNENPKIIGLGREHAQRAEIISGWQDQGMQPYDIGIVADLDETFSRDFLQAVKICDSIQSFDYERHQCHYRDVKIKAVGRVFESSPECTARGSEKDNLRYWWHPDMMLGHCIEGIGNDTIHPTAPRSDGLRRAKGWGHDCNDRQNETANSVGALWSASDFRQLCGGKQYSLDAREFPEYSRYTAFHFHNWFPNANAIRFKYRTYGHQRKEVYSTPLANISRDLSMMYHCIKEQPAPPDQKWHAVEGGFRAVRPMAPIYFQDDLYRQQRHEFVRQIVEADEKEFEKKQVL